MTAERTRVRIVAAAIDLFADRGYHDTAVDDIGRAAGIRGPSLYRHFSSKEEIFSNVLTEGRAHVFAHPSRAVELRMAPSEAVDAFVSSFVAALVSNAALTSLLLTERYVPRGRAGREFARVSRLYFERWAGRLVEVRPELTHAEALTMLHASIGAALSLTRRHESALPPDEQRWLLTELMTTALLGTGSRYREVPP